MFSLRSIPLQGGGRGPSERKPGRSFGKPPDFRSLLRHRSESGNAEFLETFPVLSKMPAFQVPALSAIAEADTWADKCPRGESPLRTDEACLASA